jgi:hypothetical protein
MTDLIVTDEDREAAEAFDPWLMDLPGGIPEAQKLLRAFARHRTAAEARGYARGVEDAAIEADNEIHQSMDYCPMRMDILDAIRALNPPADNVK